VHVDGGVVHRHRAAGVLRHPLALRARPDATDVTWILTSLFLGLALGQFFYGTLSDRFGRRPLLLAGLAISVVGAAGSALAPSLPIMFAFRVLWGFGAAGPRSIAVAMVRDSTSGVAMARLMSFVMTIFLIVPILAPSIGAGLNAVLPWQSVYWFPAACAIAIGVWSLRMPETLPPERRRPISGKAIKEAAKTVVTTRATVLLTLATTFLFGSMTAYLAQSELIIDETYGRKAQFPLVFGAIAVAMAVSSLANSKLVTRTGIPVLLRRSAIAMVSMNVLFTAVTLISGGKPPFVLFFIGMAMLLGLNNLVFPNANTAAMEPMGAIAGTAASITGVVMTAGGATLGAVIDRFADGSVTPLAVGFLVMTSCSAAMTLAALPRQPKPVAAVAPVPAAAAAD
jgi:MFS transporter, DHA1 family, multidrug resistance protein